ncbi:MAG: 3-deoxy-D-manno-octulosonic acid transferase [Bacteroidaceae bacterium]|nr:3-deoxy-D-manno-octulosonic acid transferase [Bacteroidaceae bacterium]
MRIIYDLVLHIAQFILCRVVSRFASPNSKLGKFIIGQKGLWTDVEASFSGPRDDVRPILWIHASSYGEYNIARPLIQLLRARGGYSFVLTFFSPTGIEQLQNHHEEVDYLFPMALDTRSNARRFLNAIHPEKAIFMVSEYWPNHLLELKQQQIPTFLVSAHITGHEPFFHKYGGLFRKALKAFTHIFVLDSASREHLASIGMENVTVTGDPLFDHVMARSATDYYNATVEHFVAQGDVFIAGSIHNDQDLELVAALANRHPDTHFLIVPHEINAGILSAIKEKFAGKTCCYSECTAQTDFSNVQNLMIDFIGELTYLYRYARWAYIGGGFTPYLHSVIEATAYGLPVAFGPRIERKPVAQDLMVSGLGRSVSSVQELDDWFKGLQHNESLLGQLKSQAISFMQRRQDSTDMIVKMILENEG